MKNNQNQTKVITRRIPAFLLGRKRSQWKGVMVRHDPTSIETVGIISLEDVLGDHRELGLAA